jgi:hypothetical protein
MLEAFSHGPQTRAHGYGIGDTIELSVKADAYEMVVHDAEGKRADASFYPVKTLDVGRYHFLLGLRSEMGACRLVAVSASRVPERRT